MKKNLKKAVVLIMCITVACGLLLAGCGSKSEKKEYIKESEISKAIKSPDDYKGKYIKIPGKVFNTFEDGDETCLQCYYDTENYKQEFIVKVSKDTDIDEDDFINADGKIIGAYDYETVMGADESTLGIEGKAKKSTYEKSVGKASEVRKVNKEKTVHNVRLTIRRVEFTDKETRIYVNAKNSNSGSVDMYSDNAKATQDGKQIENDYNYEAGERPTIETLSGGAEKDAVITFKKMDPEKNITLEMDVTDAENYDWDTKVKITF